MRPAELRALGVALAGIAALLRAGVSADDALRSGAQHAGPLRARLEDAAQRVGAGMDVGAALSTAIPGLAPFIGPGDVRLPARLDRLARVCARRYALARRLRAASAYPAALAVGLMVVAGAVWWAQREGERVMAMELGSWASTITASIYVAVAAGVAIWTAVALRRGEAPLWARVFPGAQVYTLSKAADFLALYGLYRDPAFGDLPPQEAAERVGAGSAEAALRAPGAASMRALADQAPDPSWALRDAVERLDTLAAGAARRLAVCMGAALLIVVALGVMGLGLSGVYQPVFNLTAMP